MWGRAGATSRPLTVTVLAALWVSVGPAAASQSPGPGCDDGKLSLDRDLPAASLHGDCPVSTWTGPIQRRPSIDTVYDPEPARRMCMNEPIRFNHTIPNSGAYRPVRAESGEYVYCPPHRWLNNLHQGATVLLYHPCAPLQERHFLSVLASSCLSEYIITPHPHLNQHMVRNTEAALRHALSSGAAVVVVPNLCSHMNNTAGDSLLRCIHNNTEHFGVLR